ncbi:hypothetical protein CRYUN_Cryun24cG0121900 [Craigia yunnanensis]
MLFPGQANYTTTRNVDSRLIRKENNPKPPNDHSRQHIFGKIDKNSPPFLTVAQLKYVFRRFDSNSDGYLSRQELTNAFNNLGSWFPDYRAVAALHHADKNGDGYISKEEMDELVQYALRCGYHVR